MTKKEKLLNRLKEISGKMNGDPEVAHGEADRALLEYINDSEINAAFEEVEKWYA